jgi:glc operon protein GlcG
MPLSFEDANRVVEKAHAKAAELGIRVAVAVLDEGGHVIALGRMDGAMPFSSQIAEAKAVGAAMFMRDGAWLAQTYQDRPGFFNAVDRMARRPLIPGLGSLPITRDGQVVGAVGVSGGRPEQDVECAVAGLSSP